MAELRLAQLAALLLALSAGAYIGLAVAHEAQPGVGFDVALAGVFFVVAAATLVRDPRQALTILALAFAAHAILDVAHRPGWPLPDGVAPAMVFHRVRRVRCVYRRALLPPHAETMTISLRVADDLVLVLVVLLLAGTARNPVHGIGEQSLRSAESQSSSSFWSPIRCARTTWTDTLDGSPAGFGD